jgi:hypothetical protein
VGVSAVVRNVSELTVVFLHATRPLAVAARSCRAVSAWEMPSAFATLVTVFAPVLSAASISRLAT